MSKYKVAGMMSGTSLDGLDIAVCELKKKRNIWTFRVDQATTVNYPGTWKEKLATAHLLPAAELLRLDHAYGDYMGKCCARFLRTHGIENVDFIASHGHTVFHQPDQGFTYQLGSGVSVHLATGLPVVCDFRSQDVQLGGQGAPLVPVGDHLLFHRYEVCLNLGGIANLSLVRNNKRKAFDVCFANMGLNLLSGLKQRKYDRNGAMAASGRTDPGLLKAIGSVYRKLGKNRPSLARETFERWVRPLLLDSPLPVEDRLNTFCESIALEIGTCLKDQRKGATMLVTGGGAWNRHLVNAIRRQAANVEVIIPGSTLVRFKEALVFALLGVLRVRGETNVYRSVTGARSDSSSGVMVGFGRQ